MQFEFNILIVDDDQEEALRYSRLLTDALERKATGCSPNLASARFNPFVIDPTGHTQQTFYQLVRRVASGADTLGQRDLHAVLIDLDYSAMVSYGDAITPQALAALFRESRPNAHRIRLTNHPRMATVETYDPSLFDGTIDKFLLTRHISADRAALVLLERLRRRMETPLWSALRSYALQDKLVFHAMAMSEGRSTEDSTLTQELNSVLGEEALFSEASLTLPPLDSLFSPTGSIKESMELTAGAFGCDAVLYCTNGTSTANKIVYQALVEPGQLAILDRNCHISHHYACMLGDVRTLFLNPEVEVGSGVPLGIQASDLEGLMNEHLQAILSSRGTLHLSDLPALIAVTNCSFDGFLLQPSSLIERYYEVIARFGLASQGNETAFLFDEAWFGFARFHPALIQYTAMGSDYSSLQARGILPRVYSTTSIHKTLSAMRQTSCVFMRDHALTSGTKMASLKTRFAQAFSCHTTTSPHMLLLASIDIARRQVELEGYRFVQTAIDAADWFRSEMRRLKDLDAAIARVFRLLEFNACERDPTKVLVEIPGTLSGAAMKAMLWSEASVQVNKFGQNSLMLMFMPGTSIEKVQNLIERLNRVAHVLLQTHILGAEQPFGTTRIPVPASFIDATGQRRNYPKDVSMGWRLGSREAVFGGLPGEIQLLPLDSDVLPAFEGLTLCSAAFVTPYPPGYPTLIPGQVVGNEEWLAVRTLMKQEVHGLTTDPSGSRLLPVIGVPTIAPRDEDASAPLG